MNKYFIVIAAGFAFFTSAVAQKKDSAVMNDRRTNDHAKKELIPIKQGNTADTKQTPSKRYPTLNGDYVLYNKKQQKTKAGVFENNRLKDGRNYIYDKDGKLVRVELYKDFKHVADTTEK